jgi:nuclear RNA export factor
LGACFDVGFVNNILELISFHCSSLNALDISRNKLQRLQAYSNLKDKCPSLKILDISDNELHHINELEHLAPMPSVTTLVLENNPFKGHVNDFASYAGQVRAYFPNLEILDGQALPGPVKFDLPTNIGVLPPSQKGYLVNEEVRSLVIQFLELFYSVYDGENRDKLLEAYSDNAVFSLSVNFTEQQRGPPFHQYMQLSRNLARQNSSKKSLLHHGRIDIVQCLRQLPHSCHIASSFNVDVLKASPSCTVFTVHGVFGEASSGKSDSYVVRAFSRTFVIIATGTG